jgi:hypothetical protein
MTKNREKQLLKEIELQLHFVNKKCPEYQKRLRLLYRAALLGPVPPEILLGIFCKITDTK